MSQPDFTKYPAGLNDGYVAPRATPNAHTYEEIDFDAMDRRLDGMPDDYDPDDFAHLTPEVQRIVQKHSRRQAAAVIHQFLIFITDGRLNHDAPKVIGHRAIGAAWLIRPDLFDGISLAALSKKLGIRQRQTLSAACAEASRFFNNFQSPATAHGWNKKKSSTDHLHPREAEPEPTEPTEDSAPEIDQESE